MFEAIGGLHRFLQAEIIDRQNILAIQDENQKHFGCPAADAVYRCQRFDHFFIAHAREAAAEGVDDAVERLVGDGLALVAPPLEDDRAGVLTRELIGVERLMWGSDYPHTEGTFPHSREQIAKDFAGIPEAEIAQMVVGNAARLYGLTA